MEKIKNLVNVLGIALGIAFLDGMFEFGISENLYFAIGLVAVVDIVWLIILVNKKQ